MSIGPSNLSRSQQQGFDTILCDSVSRKNLTVTARLIEACVNDNNGMANNKPFLSQEVLFERALKDENLETIRDLIQAGTPLNPKQADKLYNLCRDAIRNSKRNPATINTIIQHLNITKEQAESLLFAASYGDYPEIIPTLVKAGVGIDDGLHSSLLGTSTRVLQCFIDLGADKNRGLTFAVMRKKQNFVQHLIEAGADKNHGLAEAIAYDAPQFISYFLSVGANPTMGFEKAIYKGNFDAIRALVAAGADKAEGLTIALSQGKTDVALSLINMGAIPTREALKIALVKDTTEIALEFLKNWIIPDVEMLQIILRKNNRTIISWLVQNDMDSHAAIWEAAIQGMSPSSTLCFLFDEGLIPTQETITAALKHDNLDFVFAALKRNYVSDVEIWKIAVEQNRIDLFRRLTSNGWRFSKEIGKELLNMAIEKGNLDMIRELNNHGIIFDAEILKRIYAIANKNEELEFAIIGGDLPTVQQLFAPGGDKTAGLICAIHYNQSDLVRYFISIGADKDEGVRFALEDQKMPVISVLIAAGADKKKALHAAIELDAKEFAWDLLKEGVVADTETLSLAIQHDCGELVQYLLELDIKPNEKLMRDIIKEGSLKYIRTLIDLGAVMDAETRDHLMARLLKLKCANTSLFFLPRPKLYEQQVYYNGTFSPLSKVDSQFLTKPILLLNISDYETLGQYHGAINQYFTGMFDSVYEKMAKRFTLVRVMVDDPNKLVSTVDRVKAALPTLPLLHWALSGHGGPTALGLTKELFTTNNNLIMGKIGKRIDTNGTISLWGCLNGAEDNNLAKVFSESAFPTIVFASPHLVSSIVPNTFQLNPTTPVFAPFFEDDYGKPEYLRAYRGGEEVADGYKLPSRI